MMCDKCEKMVDTDFHEFAFMIDTGGGQDLCIECWEKGQESENTQKDEKNAGVRVWRRVPR